jgi:HD-GYP domain-containing protein (c-di-GMP phosphodiesterase class II)
VVQAEADDGPVPPQFTARAHRLLQMAKELVERQRAFAADPVFVGISSDARSTDPLLPYHRETIAVMDSAVRLAQVFPESASMQLKLCDGLDGVLEIVKERLTVQERALAQRRSDYHRIDRLAAVFAAMMQMRAVNLNPVAMLAEELIEDARQSRPLRFLWADPESTRSYPGSVELPAPARFLAAHCINVGQVVARLVPHDYEWAARPLPAVAAALLLDCGMLRVPADVLAKTTPLSADERRLIESHPQHGAELLVRYVPEAAALADAIATHHERTDGTGYPIGLKGSTIPSLGRLLATADAYAALCSARSHRPANDTRAALTEVLLMAERGHLDTDFAEYLVHLSFYPVGSIVELTDGRIGLVAANHPNRMDPRSPGRPVIAVLADADGQLLPRPEHVDLSASGRGGILRTLPTERCREVLGARYPDLA